MKTLSPWVSIHFWAGVDVDDLPHLRRWIEAIRARPAVQRGVAVPEPLDLRTGQDEEKLRSMGSSMLVRA